ncbi:MULTISPECIES: hypothetical protein [Ruegeria]|uniref:hypothetical protein n=1 Tax=Ruegeria TaxID=97050 RepID=UPI001488EA45|nr:MULTISPECIES: hypothetical protein [Ruegeria]MCA0930661.1 hypothetical protein [Ruegeria profundi]
MERFSEEESERLNKILSYELNPFVHGEGELKEVPLGKKTKDWLFETRMNLPSDVNAELDRIGFDELPDQVRVHLLNEILEERQVSSAPKWWEMNFFEFSTNDLWEFFVEQCRRNYEIDYVREHFDLLIASFVELEEARHILQVSKLNKSKYSREQVDLALEVFDRSYPLDFRDYEEAPRRSRSPLDKLREALAFELDKLDSVFTKRWFEFKILDELASFKSYIHEGSRDSELSKAIAGQLRHYMYGQLLALGRMVEHYRWKFSYEDAAITGVRSAKTRLRAGEAGARASRKRRLQNLESLMQQIEELSDAVGLINEERIVEQALEKTVEKRKDFPKSAKTHADYGTALRSEEPFKSRYEAVFKKNA